MNNRLRKTIQQILLAGSTAAFASSTLAVVLGGGVQIPPPGPGEVPDYFGVVPNYATSPQPVLTTVTITDTGGGSGAVAAASTYDYASLNPGAYTGGITGVSILPGHGGSGYTSATTVSVNGFGPGVVPAQVTPIIVGGVITGFTVVNPGSGYTVPMAKTGIRKFIDSMPSLNQANNLGQSLPVAVPTTITEANGKQSDYYVIAEREYTQQLHSDLPATKLRGYVQLDPSTGAMIGGKVQYLGPVIVAQKDRAVRIKLLNQLPTGTAGNLSIPVDHTYMGSEKLGDTDNRTAMHLHGGVTPWISDGLPRQWIKPAGEAGTPRGESARNVPDMWFDGSGNLIPTCTGLTTCATAGATNDPGAGALTYYYTNQQSARMMFYHDHAEGITRLNVYDGLAAGYLLQDPTEQGMVWSTTNTAGVLPPDQIPLVIQEKTFVPDNTIPVLNFYGTFASHLNSMDPTWRWGQGLQLNADGTPKLDAITGAPIYNPAPLINGSASLNGFGDLWVPHVYMTNQNPGDATGANAVGRWDYGAWFWPPFVGTINKEFANPYYDPACTATNPNPATGACEGPTIPGMPNGANLANVNGVTNPLSQPTGTPESFNDTPLVNGTVYPYYNVKPKKYRLRILSVGNDRHLNLSLVVASSKNSDTTSLANSGATSAVAKSNICDGVTLTSTLNAAECTEVRMVPWNATQHTSSKFPINWYSPNKGGVVFDGRPTGVFDPAVRGPAMVQIGTEGGFLATPATVLNQPINYEYNVKNIVIGSVKEHALLLGPAERADVIVDFSQFAGSTIILYNDAPAALPAGDLRLDYHTGDYDNTDTGGAFSTLPGYGPNTRTIMQFQVAADCTGDSTGNCNDGNLNRLPASAASTHQDDIDAAHLAKLTTAVHTAFKTSQDTIVVPQAAHNAVYGTNVADAAGADLSRISDTTLTYKPLTVDATGHATGALDATAVTLDLQPKSIIEDFTVDYGRMNAMLGVEIPKTTAILQTSIPQGYIDPATELVKISENGTPISGVLPDGTQIWKITHNGVDTHPVHFHLFSVQIINRVGWDGAISPPQDNELGWKEVVRMNPLEDVIVALRPKTMTLPFKLGNSHRTQDPGNATPAINTAMSFNLDPTSGNASDIANTAWNYGWEYVWHCHILGHEENDFMRSIAVATQPETPVASDATGASTTVTVNWTDKSVVSNWVEIKRATDPAFTQNVVPVIKLLKDVVVNPADLVNGECANQAGCAMSYKDTVPDNSSYYYQVRSNNTVGSGKGVLEGGFAAAGGYNQTLDPALDALLPVNSAGTAGFAGYGNVTANSAWSNTVSRIGLTLNAAGGLASNLATWTSNNASTSSVALNFTDNSTNESGYQVQFCQGGATNCLANAPVNATTSNVASNSNRWYTLPAANVTGTVLPGTGAASLTLTGLRISNATGYFFRIYPLNGAIVGPVSNISTIMDLTSRPADPTNVTATSAVGSSAATIAWVDASNANANYTLQLRHVNFLASATRNSTGSKRYSVRPTVVFTGGTGSGAAGTATLNGNGQVTGINITNGGTYTVAPTISLAGGTVSSGTTDSVFTANITLQTLAFSNPTVNTVTPNPLNGIATSATVTGNNMQIGGSYQFQVRANGAVGGNNSNYVIAAAVVIK